MSPVLLSLGSLSLCVTSNVLRVLVPLKCTCIPFGLTNLFKPFSFTLYVRDYNGDVPIVVISVVVCRAVVQLAGLVASVELVLKLI